MFLNLIIAWLVLLADMHDYLCVYKQTRPFDVGIWMREREMTLCTSIQFYFFVYFSHLEIIIPPSLYVVRWRGRTRNFVVWRISTERGRFFFHTPNITIFFLFFSFFFLMNNVNEWVVGFGVFVLQDGAQWRGQFGAVVYMHEPRISVLVHLLSSWQPANESAWNPFEKVT